MRHSSGGMHYKVRLRRNMRNGHYAVGTIMMPSFDKSVKYFSEIEADRHIKMSVIRRRARVFPSCTRLVKS